MPTKKKSRKNQDKRKSALLEVDIKGVRWTVQLLPNSYYTEKHKEQTNYSAALTLADEHVVDFNAVYFDKETVRHELMHAFIASCCIGSVTNLALTDLEEITCEIISIHGEDILNMANSIYSKLSPFVKGILNADKVLRQDR